jgi:hypothetical protein
MVIAIINLVPAIFLILLLAVGAYVLWRGRTPERAGLAIILIGSLLSGATAHYDALWQSGETGIFLVDGIVLLAFGIVLARSDRFWPLWVTAFQIIAVVTHLARFVSPHTVPFAYAIAEQFWVYPMLLLLTVATVRHGASRAALA